MATPKKRRQIPGSDKREMTCKKCGSRFSVGSSSLPARDKDSIDCSVCGDELLAWNGGVMFWVIELLEKHENHK